MANPAAGSNDLYKYYVQNIAQNMPKDIRDAGAGVNLSAFGPGSVSGQQILAAERDAGRKDYGQMSQTAMAGQSREDAMKQAGLAGLSEMGGKMMGPLSSLEQAIMSLSQGAQKSNQSAYLTEQSQKAANVGAAGSLASAQQYNPMDYQVYEPSAAGSLFNSLSSGVGQILPWLLAPQLAPFLNIFMSLFNQGPSGSYNPQRPPRS